MRSIRGIATIYGLLFSILVGGTGVGVYFLASLSLQRMDDARLTRSTERLIGTALPIDLAAVTARVRERLAERSISDIGYMVVDENGRQIAGRISFAPTGPGFANIHFTDGSARQHEGRALVTPLGGRALLGVVVEDEAAENFRALFTWILLIALGGATIAGVVGGYALSMTIRRRLSAIQRTAEAIIAGDLSHRIPIDGSGSEFDRQAQTLNHMLDRIGDLLGNLQQVSSDLAHDLRTPLARLRNELEGAMHAGDDPEAMRNSVAGALDQSQQILDLFAALLRISEIEAGKRKARFAPIDLAALVTDVIETFAPAIEDGGRALVGCEDAPMHLVGDRELLTQMLINLVENAARHTPPATVITVSLERKAQSIVMIVADNGPGIAEADHAIVMRRFTRLAPDRRTAGHGLGLALVAAIARLHDGEVTLFDNGPGLGVRITLVAGFPEQH